MPDMDYVVYDKDIGRDLNKNYKSILTKYKIGFGALPFHKTVSISNVSTPKAIQDDMLLKRKVRAVTDKHYEKLVDDIASFIDTCGSQGMFETDSGIDRAWQTINNEMVKVNDKIGEAAIPVIKDYMADRNEGKKIAIKQGVKKYKCVVTAVGATAASAVAVTGAVLSLGVAIAGAAVAIAGAAKAITDCVREFKRQAKEADDIIASIEKTLATLKNTFEISEVDKLDAKGVKVGTENKVGASKAAVTAQEAAAKVIRDLFATNIPSIKKLEQDTKNLKKVAKVMILTASKMAAEAAEHHKQSKELKRLLESMQAEYDTMAKAHVYGSSTAELRVLLREIKAMKARIAELKARRDEVVDGAEAYEKKARSLLGTKVPAFEQLASDLKTNRANIGWLSYATKAIPSIANLCVQDYSTIASATANVASKNDALAQLLQTSADTLVETGKTLRNRFKS